MDLNLVEDDEQEKAKKWWQENRVPIISGVVLGLSIIIGFNWWQDYKTSRSESASMLYQELIVNDADKSRVSLTATEVGQQLIDQYADTPYAGKAALILARISYDNKDLEGAREKLAWAMENSDQFETVHAARLRLATILIVEEKLDEAVELLSVEHMEGFESHYFEMRGDIYAQLGQSEKARDAYRAAIDGLAAGSMYEPVLRMKLEANTVGNKS